jgi:Ca2+-binding RTX toxin-like protein
MVPQDDVILGQGGNDCLYGGRGADELQGGGGHDLMDGGVGDGASDTAIGGAGSDAYIWAPGDGNDEFHGGEGRDWLFLEKLTFEELGQGLALAQEGLTLKLGANGVMTVVGPDGKPASFSGTLTIGGETLRFTEVERIVLLAYAPQP